MRRCVFLDRDGVINKERGEYTFRVNDFIILPGVVESIKEFKRNGFLVIIITNQAGISRGLYSREDMQRCHDYLKEQSDDLVDDIYYCPYHPSISESIARKPDTLMFERAMAKYNIDVSQSWMIGDRERDIVPAKEIGLQSILVSNHPQKTIADYKRSNLASCLEVILNS